jgi:hypothetical protein
VDNFIFTWDLPYKKSMDVNNHSEFVNPEARMQVGLSGISIGLGEITDLLPGHPSRNCQDDGGGSGHLE